MNMMFLCESGEKGLSTTSAANYRAVSNQLIEAARTDLNKLSVVTSKITTIEASADAKPFKLGVDDAKLASIVSSFPKLARVRAFNAYINIAIRAKEQAISDIQNDIAVWPGQGEYVQGMPQEPVKLEFEEWLDAEGIDLTKPVWPAEPHAFHERTEMRGIELLFRGEDAPDNAYWASLVWEKKDLGFRTKCLVAEAKATELGLAIHTDESPLRAAYKAAAEADSQPLILKETYIIQQDVSAPSIKECFMDAERQYREAESYVNRLRRQVYDEAYALAAEADKEHDKELNEYENSRSIYDEQRNLLLARYEREVITPYEAAKRDRLEYINASMLLKRNWQRDEINRISSMKIRIPHEFEGLVEEIESALKGNK